MTPTELHKSTGISVAYASMLLSGKRDTLSLSKALLIYEKTDLQFGILKGMTRDEIEPLLRQEAS